MKQLSYKLAVWMGVLILTVGSHGLAQERVLESQREIPVLHEVDVAVVGGTSAGITAAVEAADNGAEVFLAAPRPYLGEDLCATYRLWLDPDEEPQTPLAKEMFAEPEIGKSIPEGYSFEYETSIPSASKHPDTETPSRLNDGLWKSASRQSVQYDGDVEIVVQLPEERYVHNVHVMAYQRNEDFEVDHVKIYESADKENWNQVATVHNEKLGQGGFEDIPLNLEAEIDQKTEFLKFDVIKGEKSSRILLGEIIVSPAIKEEESESSQRIPPKPMQIKYALEQAMIDADVKFLYSCYTTDVLKDENGDIAGIVIVNRSGRQAIKAKVVIDAMHRADFARLSGASFKDYPQGEQMFKRVVIGGEAVESEKSTVRKMPSPVYATPRNMRGSEVQRFDAFEYTLRLPMEDGSYASFAEAEQRARDKTWQKGQIDASEVLYQIPPDPMIGESQWQEDWPGVETIDIKVFRPKGMERLYVLGPCADLSRKAAEKMMRPLEYLELGRKIGKAAAQEANAMDERAGVRLYGEEENASDFGEVREQLQSIRTSEKYDEAVLSEATGLPVLGRYDVVVIGGGTGGAPAGIGAARQGAKTLVVEYLHGLGGIGTLGLIGSYYYGHRDGFTEELDQGIEVIGEGSDRGRGWNIEHKMEWYRREIRRPGGDIWYGTLGCGTLVQDEKVVGAIVATPQGRGIVLTDVLIDSTGGADMAIAAGSDYMFAGESHAALQGTGLPPRQPDANYTNTDYTFTDDSDVVDIWRSFVMAREKFKEAYDLAQIVDTRERKRIVGDFIVSPIDIMLQRTYPDTVVMSRSNFDSHGYTIHPAFMLRPPDKETLYAYTPYRALLPKGLEGIIVTGLGISAHRDAMPILRMQPCIQNQGYAMGVAASMAADNHGITRDIDIKKLQKHLVEKGSLPESVITDEDSLPFSKEEVQEAVEVIPQHLRGFTAEKLSGDPAPPPEKDPVSVILAQTEDSIPMIKEAYQEAEEEDEQLIYAHILGILGEPEGANTLLKSVEEREWDKGWSFKGMGQFGSSLSPLDSLLIALGRSGEKEALPVIVEKMELLDAESEFSHHRAVAVALESIGDPSAAEPLARLLKKPGIMGHAVTTLEEMKEKVPVDASGVEDRTRDRTLRELVLARALYRCGDYNGLGEHILKQYAKDLRALYARHAQNVLNNE